MGSAATKVGGAAISSAAPRPPPRPRPKRLPPGFEQEHSSASSHPTHYHQYDYTRTGALERDRELSRENPLQDISSADGSVKVRRRAVDPLTIEHVNARNDLLIENMNKLSAAVHSAPMPGVFPTEEQRAQRLREVSPIAAAAAAGNNSNISRPNKNLPKEKRTRAPLTAAEDPLAVGRLTAQQIQQILSPAITVDQRQELIVQFRVDKDLVAALQAHCTLIVGPSSASSSSSNNIAGIAAAAAAVTANAGSAGAQHKRTF